MTLQIALETPLLVVRGLTKTYGVRIGCSEVSFDLYPGEVLGIVGESDSGKSTLLSCLAGHLPPDRGEVLYDAAEGLADPPNWSGTCGDGAGIVIC